MEQGGESRSASRSSVSREQRTDETSESWSLDKQLRHRSVARRMRCAIRFALQEVAGTQRNAPEIIKIEMLLPTQVSKCVLPDEVCRGNVISLVREQKLGINRALSISTQALLQRFAIEMISFLQTVARSDFLIGVASPSGSSW